MDYFDSVVTWARKPGFWTQPERMFYTVKNNREGDMIGSLKDKTVYAQGSCNKLNQLLKQLTGKDQPKMVYVGKLNHHKNLPSFHYYKAIAHQSNQIFWAYVFALWTYHE